MKIIIVDDDCLVAAALKTILEVNEDVQVAATGVNGKEACQLYEEYQPDVLLMDIRMKEMDGLEASQKILEKFPKANILLLTTFADDEYIVKALRLGAKGYLLKQDYGSILPAIRAVDSGQTEIIRLIANGCSNKEIAAELFLSEGTVRNYLSSILEKLQLRDRTQVAVFYYQHR